MDRLNDDVILAIFDYLDNDSMLNFMKASNRFAALFSASLTLQHKFQLVLNDQSTLEMAKSGGLPAVPFRNVLISGIAPDSILLGLMSILKGTIETLHLQNIQFNDLEECCRLLSGLSSLTSLRIQGCEVYRQTNASVPILPSLKCVAFEQCCSSFFSLFAHQKSIEQLSVSKGDWKWTLAFNALAATLPNLNHIVMDGHETAGYFDNSHFPYKIRKLEAYLLTSYWASRSVRLSFLKSQQGSLKELTLHKLPYDYDGGQVLKFIIEEMRLKTFHYGSIPLILDGRKQHVDSFLAFEVHITSFFEMFKQFPSIRSFTLFLTQTGIDPNKTKEIIDPPTNLFEKLQHLDILDHSGKLLLLFVGLYKNCRSITKLTIRSNDNDINAVLRECLPEMTQLRELHLESDAANKEERMEIIERLAPNVVML